METRNFRITEHQIPGSFIRQHRRATINKNDTVRLAVKEYRNENSPSGGHNEISIIGAHANGFPKELYEPLWDELAVSLAANGLHVSVVLIADISFQGQSGVLNSNILGNDPSWLDHPRDLFLMVNHFRDSLEGPIVAVGHSMGANNLVNLSILHPKLFSAIIIIDPAISPTYNARLIFPARLSVKRRTNWPSRSEAAAGFKRSKFYQSWDPRVLDLWTQYGIRQISEDSEKVELATPRDQEILAFLRVDQLGIEKRVQSVEDQNELEATELYDFFDRREIYETFHRLSKLEPSALFIHGGLSAVSPPDVRRGRIQQTLLGRTVVVNKPLRSVDNVLFDDIGHLIPMEIPRRTAEAIAEWLPNELREVQRLEDEDMKAWAGLPKEARSKLSYKSAAVLGAGQMPQRDYAKGKL